MNKSLKNKLFTGILLTFIFLFFTPCQSQQKSLQPGWPSVTKESKPWSRWWWMGSSVNPSDLNAAMEAYSKAGLGGLEITPIYGVHGYEDKFVKFLSPQWVENLQFTLQEGKRLDMGIDLAMASGWPFGGLWVTPEDACKYMSVQSYALKGGEQLQEKVALTQTPMLRTISRKNLVISQLKYPVGANADSLQNWAIEQARYPKPMPFQTLMAYSDKKEIVNLTTKVDADGKLNWTAPTGNWKLYAVFEGWHGKMVERAGPGGEGDVIDHFSSTAIDNYLGHFTTSFKNQDISGLRAYFNDSYEVDDARGEADFTPLMFDEFQKRRGYDLRNYLPALIGEDSEDNNSRVLCDYRETISDLILDKYTQRWHDWAAKGGKIIRNQAHGAPANILDLYGVADIPETEGEDIVKIKTASSSAHVTGKKLASSESVTWLKDHFEASLSDVKQAIDRFLLGGVNHIFYHGTTFSPKDAPWPGWMFYAAVHFGPTNTIWKDFGTLNTYITRSQTFLQAGKPDNDILLYYPTSDEYAVRGRSLLLHFDGAAKGSSVRKSAESLFEKGYAFDYISDRQILKLKSESGKVLTGGTIYQTILLPPVKLIPIETFEKIIGLAKGGATILMEQLPIDVPGMGKLAERQAKFQSLLKSIKFEPTFGNIQKAKVGKGMILLGNQPDLLAQAEIRRETMFDKGLQCIRRIDGNTTTYFIANRGTETVDGMIPISTKTNEAVLYNPMHGNFGKAITKTTGNKSEVYLQLNSGESCLVQILPRKVNTPQYAYMKASGEKISINTDWTLTFVSGGPELPQTVKLSKLGSWTELEGDSYKAFSGTAVYKTSFAKPIGNAKFYRLDLGKVAHSARVSLNGKELVVLIGSPFSVDIPVADLKAENMLEISVTNLMGNRIADMERKGQPYKIFYNTNFPAYDAINRGADGLFTTLGWKPQESGLFGPVTLIPLEQIFWFSVVSQAKEKQALSKFDFGPGKVKKGWTQVTAKTIYSSEKGFGLIPSGEMVSGKIKSKDAHAKDFLSSKKPFYFVVNLPEGHYQIILTLGGAQEGSSTTVKAESRRLMLENVKTGKGETVQKIIAVDVRTPKINATEQIRLKERELKYLNWDNKLTLEFNGENPCVAAIEIKKADELPTIFLAGNSTVTDQENEPWASWGQMFPRFLKPEIVVANYAESGESLLSFKGEKRLQKLLSQMKSGDYLFIEFAHNDQKPGSSHLDAFTTYKDELKYFIEEVRKKGGKPVLVTSMHRRRFDDKGQIINTLENYPEAMRQTAKEENVPLIDLNAMSKKFYEAMGSENSKKAFVHFPANTYPGQEKALADDTHFNPYGAYELAKCIVEGIWQNNMELTKYIVDGLPAFNPAHPDAINEFHWYESPSVNLVKPDGN